MGSRARSGWWTHKDAARLLARAEATTWKPISTEELRHLRAHADLLLHGPLSPWLSEHDRSRIEVLHRDLLAALSLSAGERIGMP